MRSCLRLRMSRLGSGTRHRLLKDFCYKMVIRPFGWRGWTLGFELTVIRTRLKTYCDVGIGCLRPKKEILRGRNMYHFAKAAYWKHPHWNAICLCEVAGGQNGTATDFFPNYLLFSFTIIPPVLHNHSSITNTT